MSSDDNPEEPFPDEGEVVSGPNRWSFNRMRAVFLIFVLLVVVAALSATVAVTADRAINGVATPDMVATSLKAGEASSESEAVDDGAGRNLSSEMVAAYFDYGITSSKSKVVEDGADRHLSTQMVSASLDNEVASSSSGALKDEADLLFPFDGQRDLAFYCPVDITAWACGYSTTYASRLCGTTLGRYGCRASLCDIYAYNWFYSRTRRCWMVYCACN